MVTTWVKHINNLVYFLQVKFENGLFIPKYDKSSFMREDMCTKPCSGPIISWSTKWITALKLYPTIDTKHYQLMRLHKFVVN